jgi:two-component system chemotaxis response regulator CheY
MPEMTGIESLKAIRALDSNAKIVMVSAMGQEKMVMDAVMSGAKSFIVKPFKEEQVLNTLSKILAM